MRRTDRFAGLSQRLAPILDGPSGLATAPEAVRAAIEAHEAGMDHRSISLYAGTNIPSPAWASIQTTAGSRPSLGDPGAKYETGLEEVEAIEVLATELARRLLGARHADVRPLSGGMANLIAYLAAARPGDRALVLPTRAAGHATHQAFGAAGLVGLQVEQMPYDNARLTVDLDALRARVRELAAAGDPPRVIVIGASLMLFPLPVGEVRAIADEVGAIVMYDAAHVAGLVCSRRFQDPLAEGAHIVTCSTYKSFGGPAGGLIGTNDDALAERIHTVVYPGLIANFDLGRVAAFAVAAAELASFGPVYADAMIATGAALGEALAAEGLPVVRRAWPGDPGDGAATASHHVAIQAASFGGGTAAARRAARAGLLFSGIPIPRPALPGARDEASPDENGIRLGTQEVTRQGMGPAEMATVARFLARALRDGEASDETAAARLASEVAEFRAAYQEVRYSFAAAREP